MKIMFECNTAELGQQLQTVCAQSKHCGKPFCSPRCCLQLLLFATSTISKGNQQIRCNPFVTANLATTLAHGRGYKEEQLQAMSGCIGSQCWADTFAWLEVQGMVPAALLPSVAIASCLMCMPHM